jgi:hypothetical protein
VQGVGQHGDGDAHQGDRHRCPGQGQELTPAEVFSHLGGLLGIEQGAEAAVPGHAQQAHQHGGHREHRQGHGHLPARFVGVGGMAVGGWPLPWPSPCSSGALPAAVNSWACTAVSVPRNGPSKVRKYSRNM